jgi:hypothetical protein
VTKKARVVLQDCEHAIAKHTLELQGEELRVSWAGIWTLLRAVGHVLDKVDSKASPAIAQAVEEWWASLNGSKPEPAVFWKFIEPGRNRIVKLYEHGIWRQLELEGPELNGERTTIWVDQANSQGGRMSADSGRVISQLDWGPFAGRLEREAAVEACRWWHGVLDGLDARAEEIAQTGSPSAA